MLKAIFFDIDNTLFPSRKFVELARRNAISAMVQVGLPFDEEHLYKRLLHIVKRYGSNYPHHFERLLDDLNWDRDPKIVAAGIAAYHNTKLSLSPYPDVPKTLLALRDMGYRLYVLSQGLPVKQWDKLIRLGLHFFFTDVFVTEKAKDTAFYKRVLRKLKLKPSEALMVGDKPKSDIVPAKRAGIRTVLIAPAGRKQGADFRIRTMHELLKVVSKIKNA